MVAWTGMMTTLLRRRLADSQQVFRRARDEYYWSRGSDGDWHNAGAQRVPNILANILSYKTLVAKRIVSPGHLVGHLVAVGFCPLFSVLLFCVALVCVCGWCWAFFVDV